MSSTNFLNLTDRNHVNKLNSLSALLSSWLPKTEVGKKDRKAIADEMMRYRAKNSDDEAVLLHFETLVTSYMGRKIGETTDRVRAFA